MIMKPILYLITNDFPFGNGEASFILPELPYLKDKFDAALVLKAGFDSSVGIGQIKVSTAKLFTGRRIYALHRKSYVLGKVVWNDT